MVIRREHFLLLTLQLTAIRRTAMAHWFLTSTEQTIQMKQTFCLYSGSSEWWICSVTGIRSALWTQSALVQEHSQYIWNWIEFIKATTSDNPDFDKNDNNSNNNNNNSNGSNNSSSLGNSSLGNNSLGSSSLEAANLVLPHLEVVLQVWRVEHPALDQVPAWNQHPMLRLVMLYRTIPCGQLSFFLGGVVLLAGIMEYNRKKKQT